jgi:alpha-1,2-rhamnosyltransferase
MGSDIAVFREIGGEFMAYFDLQDPQSLADLIMRFLQSGQFPAARDVADWRWIDWHEASAQLAERTVRNAVQAPLAPARPHAHCP